MQESGDTLRIMIQGLQFNKQGDTLFLCVDANGVCLLLTVPADVVTLESNG